MSAESYAADGVRRKATLSAQQEVGLAALLAGASVVEAAAQAGVARQTLSAWLHHDPDFGLELQRRRAELWDGLRRRLEATGARALDALAGALDDRDVRVRVAAAVKLLGFLGGELCPYPPSPAATDDDPRLSRLALAIQQKLSGEPDEALGDEDFRDRDPDGL